MTKKRGILLTAHPTIVCVPSNLQQLLTKRIEIFKNKIIFQTIKKPGNVGKLAPVTDNNTIVYNANIAHRPTSTSNSQLSVPVDEAHVHCNNYQLIKTQAYCVNYQLANNKPTVSN